MRDVVEVCGVGQLVEIDNAGVRVGKKVPAHRGANEAGAASNENGRALKSHDLTVL
jgi:hypothetical protein